MKQSTDQLPDRFVPRDDEFLALRIFDIKTIKKPVKQSVPSLRVKRTGMTQSTNQLPDRFVPHDDELTNQRIHHFTKGN